MKYTIATAIATFLLSVSSMGALYWFLTWRRTAGEKAYRKTTPEQERLEWEERNDALR